MESRSVRTFIFFPPFLTKRPGKCQEQSWLFILMSPTGRQRVCPRISKAVVQLFELIFIICTCLNCRGPYFFDNQHV